MSICPHCQTDNPPNAKYCLGCGSPMQTAPGAASPGAGAVSSVVGKTCPYCQAPFKHESDVVLCPVCAMPHHRECWAENGNSCTTFGCTGTTGHGGASSRQRPTSAADSQDNVVVCPHCNTPNRLRPDQNFRTAACGSCHQGLDPASQIAATMTATAVPVERSSRTWLWIVAAIIGIFIVGAFVYNAAQNGNGTITLQDGSMYTGSYKSRIPEGQGTLERKDGTKYVGNFRDGKYNGQGALSKPDGSKYAGYFVDNQFHGEGTLTTANGRTYKGNFQNGRLNGQGSMTATDGTKYTGQFMDGKYHGEGTLEAPGAGKLTATFRDGKPDGKGTFYFQDGSYTKGSFSNGELHGLVQLFRPNVDYIFEKKFYLGKEDGREIKKAPFIIRSKEVYNSLNNTRLSSGPKFYSQDIRYISYNLEVVSVFPRPVQGVLEVIYREPNGTVKRNPSVSPAGITFTDKISLGAEGATQKLDQGWGNSNGGTYQRGRHKIEFWWGDVKVDEIAFEVY